MILPKEDPTLILSRRYRSILEVCGKGAILFACWSIVKGLMYLFLGDNLIREIDDIAAGRPFGRAAIIICLLFLIALDLMLRLCAARMAFREARGEKAGAFSLFITFLLILYSLFSITALFAQQGMDKYFTLSDRLISAFVELTSVFNLIEIMYYSFRLKHLPNPIDTSFQEGRLSGN